MIPPIYLTWIATQVNIHYRYSLYLTAATLHTWQQHPRIPVAPLPSYPTVAAVVDHIAHRDTYWSEQVQQWCTQKRWSLAEMTVLHILDAGRRTKAREWLRVARRDAITRQEAVICSP